jgi:glycosyltransferase involved in cell wall biosynthesis
VITVHDLHFLHYPQFMTADSRRFYNDQVAWAVKKADHILVDSQATRDDLGNLLNVPGEKMTVHLLGVNKRFHPLPDSVVAEARARLGLPASYILFVGTFEPRKNIPGLLEAYNILLQENPETPQLVLVGRRGWLYEEIFARVKALDLADNLIWLENTADSDLPAIYNGAAVLVLPSHYEGFGLPALEAMACGTPAIVANRSSLPEVVGAAVVGAAGLLVEPDDPAMIAAAVQRVLEDSALNEQLRRDGLAHAAHFTWRRTAETVLSVYRALLI